MMVPRVHVWMQRTWQVNDLGAFGQEGKHQPTVIHNTQLMFLDARSRTPGYADFCYVIKGILIQSLPMPSLPGGSL